MPRPPPGFLCPGVPWPGLPVAAAPATATLSTGNTGRALTSSAAGTIAHVRKQERPLIVVSPAVVHADGGVLALADDTHDAAAGLAAFSDKLTGRPTELTGPSAELTGPPNATARRLGRRAALLPLLHLAEGRLTASAATTLLHLLRLLRLLWLTLWNSGRHRDDLKIAVGDRVFVFLAQEPLLHEEVNRRREVPRSDLALIEVDGPCVLLASEDELGFLLALDLVTPHRHRHGHQDHHHRRC